MQCTTVWVKMLTEWPLLRPQSSCKPDQRNSRPGHHLDTKAIIETLITLRLSSWQRPIVTTREHTSRDLETSLRAASSDKPRANRGDRKGSWSVANSQPADPARERDDGDFVATAPPSKKMNCVRRSREVSPRLLLPFRRFEKTSPYSCLQRGFFLKKGKSEQISENGTRARRSRA